MGEREADNIDRGPWKWEVNGHGGGSNGDTETEKMLIVIYPYF